MVLPDGTGSERNRPRTGRAALFVIAALVVVMGFILLGSLTPPERAALEETTTTTTTTPATSTTQEIEPPIDRESFSIDQIAPGEPLSWEQGLTSGMGYPLALTEYEGVMYLFASTTPYWRGEPGGLIAWRSTDGQTWEAIRDPVIDREYRVSVVTATSEGLFAAGGGPEGEHLILWQSDEGIEWAAQEIPTETASPYTMPYSTAIAAADERVVVATNIRVDREGLLQDHLTEAGIDADLSETLWETRFADQDGTELVVFGPLRIPALTTTLEDLGLSDQERDWLIGGQRPDSDSDAWATTWARDNSGVWTSGKTVLRQVTSIAARPDGTFLATGFGGAGIGAAHLSADGIHWRAIEDTPGLGDVVSWGERLVGLSNQTVEVMMSADGLTWQETGIGQEFPSFVSWYPTAIGAGAGGVALSVEGRDLSDFTPSSESPRLTAENGATLTIDFMGNSLQLGVDGETHTWEMYSGGSTGTPEGLEVDLESEVVRFMEPETGETLATFGFEELRRAEHEARSIELSDLVSHHAMVLSQDGSDWEITDLGSLVGDGSRISRLEVGLGSVVAVVERPIFNPNEAQQSGFEIWSAEIP